MELLQHHAAPHYARGAARRLLRFGLALPPRRRCDGALDGQRLPPPSRPLRRGAAALHQPEPSRLELSLPLIPPRTFDIPASEALRQIVVRAPVASLALRVVRGGAGFTGYGVQFEDAAGVTVDNYSIRSNNGQALFRHKPLGQRPDRRLRGVRSGHPAIRTEHHAGGGHQLLGLRRPREKMIAFVRSCFPEAAVLVLDQRPFGEVRHGIRPDVVGAGDGRLATPRSPCHRRRLVGLRRHAGAGRHGTFRRQRLGGARTIPISTTPAAVRWPMRWSMRWMPA